jgi:hypothetical protein
MSYPMCVDYVIDFVDSIMSIGHIKMVLQMVSGRSERVKKNNFKLCGKSCAKFKYF